MVESRRDGNEVTWPKVFAAIISITTMSIGGLGMALSWHSASPKHGGAVSHDELGMVHDRIERERSEITARLDRIENRQQAILDLLRQQR